MIEFQLNGTTTFGIEYLKDKFRLIVFNDKKELACRKASKQQIVAFLTESNGSLFNGRLQLHKFGKELLITVKGIRIGSMPSLKLLEIINQFD